MKALYLLFAVLMAAPTLRAQYESSASSPISTTNAQTVVLSGKVSVAGDAAPSAMTSVVLQCGGQERARVNAGPDGQFMLPVPAQSEVPDRAQGTRANDPTVAAATAEQWSNCELYADAAGYRSERLQLYGNLDTVTQVGVITLHPVVSGNGDGDTVSVISLAAPGNAKKDFEKGQQQEKKGKWASACAYFKRAIEAYPRYALAWAELGRSQAKQNDFVGAQQSLHRAVEADSHFMQGYVQLAQLALQRSEWKELADVTAQMVQLAPTYSAQYWFLNSAANYNLGNMPAAETSATRGLRLDQSHQVPQLEYLYAMILASHHDYQSAVSHLQSFIHLVPKGKDVTDAQSRLAEFQKLAQATPVASR